MQAGLCVAVVVVVVATLLSSPLMVRGGKDIELYCAACHMLVDEMFWELKNHDPKKKIECDATVEEFEDQLLELFQEEHPDLKNHFCMKVTGYCEKEAPHPYAAVEAKKKKDADREQRRAELRKAKKEKAKKEKKEKKQKAKKEKKEKKAKEAVEDESSHTEL